ncbi:hypothetical protein BJ165DRAFT_344302 [Panaeolus papilionaceus]|nr:hypothetical protein BJ165DRAFT_344302 [Panaeolus papilionaceus]
MSNTGHPGYDEKLLADAPAVDKGMLQGGYTTDLLEKPKASPTPPPDLEAGRKQPPRSSQRDYSNPPPSSKPAPLPEKTPFFRTTKGIVVIVVAFIVILAAVVGGAVGGTKKKNNKVDAQSSGNSTGPDTGSSSLSQATVGPSGSGGPAIGTTSGNVTSPSVTDGVGPRPTSSNYFWQSQPHFIESTRW